MAEVAVKVFKVDSEATPEQLAAVQMEIDIIRGKRQQARVCGASRPWSVQNLWPAVQ